MLKRCSITQSQLDGASGPKQRRQSKAQKPDGADKISGIIKRVELHDFMKFTNLAVDFKPRVNFVIGGNGSGKSALLTGLIIGLGGRASAIYRRSQLTDFIRYGKNIAEIKVTLSNEGVDAYHPELYGDSIIVERKLTRSVGGSDYKIKTSIGRLVSTSKADLRQILDYFNIQVENPVAILTQAASKNLLRSTNPSDLYKFFFEATQLDQMHNAEASSERNEATQHERLKKQVAAMRKRQPEYVEQHKKALEDVEKAKESRREVEEKIKAMAGDAETLEPRRGELKKELNNKKQISRAKFQAAEQIEKEMQGIESQKKIMEDRVKDIQSKDAQIKERDEKVEILAITLKGIEQNHADAKAQMNEACQNLSALAYKRNEHTSNVNELERLKGEHETRISELEKKKTARFGRKAPALQGEIERLWRTGKFKRKPFGPLGQHITVKDMRYALCIEKALGNLMTAFLVDNKYDRAVLDTAKKKVYGQERGPPFVVSQYTERRHDIHGDRAETNHPTLSDLLEIDNNIVYNTIVDLANPQNIVMVMDAMQARDLMENPPKNCSACYNGRGDQLIPNPLREYGNREKHPKFLSALTEENIRVESQALRTVIQELTNKQEKLDSFKLDIQSTNWEHTKLKGQVNILDKHIRKLKADLNDLKNQEFEEKANKDADTLLEDIRGFVEEIGKITENYQEAKSAYEASRAEEKAVEQQLADILARIREVNQNIDPFKAELNKAVEDIDRANNAVPHYLRCLTEYDARLQAKENEVMVMKTYLETRRRNLFKITVSTGSRTKVFFTTLLNQRNYDGKLEFDHDERTLVIKVYPLLDEEAANRDLNGLPEGEKSFSTLCFLMSLWESVHSPFRCMDEFDAFMDKATREVSIKMLLEFARGYPKHQFIFLTPQDTGEIDLDDYVHVFHTPGVSRERMLLLNVE